MITRTEQLHLYVGAIISFYYAIYFNAMCTRALNLGFIGLHGSSRDMRIVNCRLWMCG